jgi:anti-anti-sigma factor
MQEDSRVIIGIISNGYIVKVKGKGTMEYCSELFQFLSDKIENENIENIYFELSDATYLDSSFIGVIISIQKKLKKLRKGNVLLLNPSKKSKEIMSTMGLLDIMPIQEDHTFKNIEVSGEIKKRLEKNYKDIKILLESHQNLMELNNENRKRFSLVEEMLKKDLEKEKK